MARQRFSFSFATVMLLVLLRVAVGWHFFEQGAHHVKDPSWSSEGFLRQAQGPLAPYYQRVIPDYHGWDRILHAAGAGPAALDAWSKEVGDAWEAYRRDFVAHYGLSEQQRADAEKVSARRQEQFQDWLKQNEEAIASHMHEWQRLATWRVDEAAREVPYRKQRIKEKQAQLNAEANSLLAQVKGLEKDLKSDLDRLLTEEQRGAGEVPHERSQLEKIDLRMKYGILAIGACLIVGLFTRLAAVLGAVFLLSVIMTQPFWLPDAGRTYDQCLEMLVLLTLATTSVGRWGGLDFFIHYLFIGRRSSRKVSQA